MAAKNIQNGPFEKGQAAHVDWSNHGRRWNMEKPENPHRLGTVEARLWQSGWDSAVLNVIRVQPKVVLI